MSLTDLSVVKMSVDIRDVNGQIIAQNTPLNGIAEVSNVRKTFEMYCKKRDQILTQEFSICNSGPGYPFKYLTDGCTGVLSGAFRVIQSDLLIKPFIFKYKNAKKGIEPLSSFYASRLKYSLAKNIMAEESIDLFTRAKRAAYIAYDYWYHKKVSIREISFCVRTELQNLISYIIDVSDKSPGRNGKDYRELNTMEMVEALRLKLDAEELLASI